MRVADKPATTSRRRLSEVGYQFVWMPPHFCRTDGPFLAFPRRHAERQLRCSTARGTGRTVLGKSPAVIFDQETGDGPDVHLQKNYVATPATQDWRASDKKASRRTTEGEELGVRKVLK
jgi:hypothetical protein